MISEHFDALAKQVPGASLQSEQFQSAIDRFCEITITTGRCTRQEIEQVVEKFDVILARYRDPRVCPTHSLDIDRVCEAGEAGGA